MSDMASKNLIYIIIGLLVFVSVLIAMYFFFKNQVISFFQGLGGSPASAFRALLS